MQSYCSGWESGVPGRPRTSTNSTTMTNCYYDCGVLVTYALTPGSLSIQLPAVTDVADGHCRHVLIRAGGRVVSSNRTSTTEYITLSASSLPATRSLRALITEV